MKFSILTATYNREAYLTKLYKSILQNKGINYDIEWLIMDDGSTDKTEQLVKSFIGENKLEIKFFKQENQGKMQAINNLAKFVSGDFWIEVDSDDYFVENAFDFMYKKSSKFKDNSNIYALLFLKNEHSKKLSGNEFFDEDKDTTLFNIYFKANVTGEKIILFRTKIRKEYKYILEPGEKFCTEARMHHKMDLNYCVRCYNTVIVEGEYQSDGYTKNMSKIFKENPMGYYKYFYEILNVMDNKNMLFRKRLYAIKHLILFSSITNKKCKVKGFFNNFIKNILYVPGKIKTKIYLNSK